MQHGQSSICHRFSSLPQGNRHEKSNCRKIPVRQADVRSVCNVCVQCLRRKDMTLKEAEVLALSVLKQVMEEKVGATAAVFGASMHGNARMLLQMCAFKSLLERLHPFPLHETVLLEHVQVTPTNVDIARVAPAYHLYTTEEIQVSLACSKNQHVIASG